MSLSRNLAVAIRSYIPGWPSVEVVGIEPTSTGCRLALYPYPTCHPRKEAGQSLTWSGRIRHASPPPNGAERDRTSVTSVQKRRFPINLRPLFSYTQLSRLPNNMQCISLLKYLLFLNLANAQSVMTNIVPPNPPDHTSLTTQVQPTHKQSQRVLPKLWRLIHTV